MGIRTVRGGWAGVRGGGSGGDGGVVEPLR